MSKLFTQLIHDIIFTNKYFDKNNACSKENWQKLKAMLKNPEVLGESYALFKSKSSEFSLSKSFRNSPKAVDDMFSKFGQLYSFDKSPFKNLQRLQIIYAIRFRHPQQSSFRRLEALIDLARSYNDPASQVTLYCKGYDFYQKNKQVLKAEQEQGSFNDFLVNIESDGTVKDHEINLQKKIISLYKKIWSKKDAASLESRQNAIAWLSQYNPRPALFETLYRDLIVSISTPQCRKIVLEGILCATTGVANTDIYYKAKLSNGTINPNYYPKIALLWDKLLDDPSNDELIWKIAELYAKGINTAREGLEQKNTVVIQLFTLLINSKNIHLSLNAKLRLAELWKHSRPDEAISFLIEIAMQPNDKIFHITQNAHASCLINEEALSRLSLYYPVTLGSQSPQETLSLHGIIFGWQKFYTEIIANNQDESDLSDNDTQPKPENHPIYKKNKNADMIIDIALTYLRADPTAISETFRKASLVLEPLAARYIQENIGADKANYWLGMIYLQGGRGIENDPLKALTHLEHTIQQKTNTDPNYKHLAAQLLAQLYTVTPVSNLNLILTPDQQLEELLNCAPILKQKLRELTNTSADDDLKHEDVVTFFQSSQHRKKNAGLFTIYPSLTVVLDSQNQLKNLSKNIKKILNKQKKLVVIALAILKDQDPQLNINPHNIASYEDLAKDIISNRKSLLANKENHKLFQKLLPLVANLKNNAEYFYQYEEMLSKQATVVATTTTPKLDLNKLEELYFKLFSLRPILITNNPELKKLSKFLLQLDVTKEYIQTHTLDYYNSEPRFIAYQNLYANLAKENSPTATGLTTVSTTTTATSTTTTTIASSSTTITPSLRIDEPELAELIDKINQRQRQQVIDEQLNQVSLSVIGMASGVKFLQQFQTGFDANLPEGSFAALEITDLALKVDIQRNFQLGAIDGQLKLLGNFLAEKIYGSKSTEIVKSKIDLFIQKLIKDMNTILNVFEKEYIHQLVYRYLQQLQYITQQLHWLQTLSPATTLLDLKKNLASFQQELLNLKQKLESATDEHEILTQQTIEVYLQKIPKPLQQEMLYKIIDTILPKLDKILINLPHDSINDEELYKSLTNYKKTFTNAKGSNLSDQDSGQYDHTAYLIDYSNDDTGKTDDQSLDNDASKLLITLELLRQAFYVESVIEKIQPYLDATVLTATEKQEYQRVLTEILHSKPIQFISDQEIEMERKRLLDIQRSKIIAEFNNEHIKLYLELVQLHEATRTIKLTSFRDKSDKKEQIIMASPEQQLNQNYQAINQHQGYQSLRPTPTKTNIQEDETEVLLDVDENSNSEIIPQLSAVDSRSNKEKHQEIIEYRRKLLTEEFKDIYESAFNFLLKKQFLLSINRELENNKCILYFNEDPNFSKNTYGIAVKASPVRVQQLKEQGKLKDAPLEDSDIYRHVNECDPHWRIGPFSIGPLKIGPFDISSLRINSVAIGPRRAGSFILGLVSFYLLFLLRAWIADDKAFEHVNIDPNNVSQACLISTNGDINYCNNQGNITQQNNYNSNAKVFTSWFFVICIGALSAMSLLAVAFTWTKRPTDIRIREVTAKDDETVTLDVSGKKLDFHLLTDDIATEADEKQKFFTPRTSNSFWKLAHEEIKKIEVAQLQIESLETARKTAAATTPGKKIVPPFQIVENSAPSTDTEHPIGNILHPTTPQSATFTSTTVPTSNQLTANTTLMTPAFNEQLSVPVSTTPMSAIIYTPGSSSNQMASTAAPTVPIIIRRVSFFNLAPTEMQLAQTTLVEETKTNLLEASKDLTGAIKNLNIKLDQAQGTQTTNFGLNY